MKSAKMIAAVVCIVSFAAGVSEAALITPTGATASSELPNAVVGAFSPGNLIDDSGLSGTDPHAITDTHTAAFSSSKNVWASDTADPTPSPTDPVTVIFDLGATYDVTDLHIWQYARASLTSSNNPKDITVEFSTGGTGGTFGSGVGIQLALWTDINDAAQNFAITQVSANAVRFTITSVHSGIIGGLSEVKFSVVPEPHSLAISSIFLLGLGMVRRRRNRQS